MRALPMGLLLRGLIANGYSPSFVGLAKSRTTPAMTEGRGKFGALALGAWVLCACGNGGASDAGFDAGAPPRIMSFFASPAMVQWDGGTTTLMFETSGATSLSIAPGVGDVSGR